MKTVLTNFYSHNQFSQEKLDESETIYNEN